MALDENGLEIQKFTSLDDEYILEYAASLNEGKVYQDGKVLDPEMFINKIVAPEDGRLPNPIRNAIVEGLRSAEIDEIASAAYMLWLLRRITPAWADKVVLPPVAEARMLDIEMSLEFKSPPTEIDGVRNPAFVEKLNKYAAASLNITKETLPSNVNKDELRERITGQLSGSGWDESKMDDIFKESTGYKKLTWEGLDSVDPAYKAHWEELFLHRAALLFGRDKDDALVVKHAAEGAHSYARRNWIMYQMDGTVHTTHRGINSWDLKFDAATQEEWGELFKEYSRSDGVTTFYESDDDGNLTKVDTRIDADQLFSPDPDDAGYPLVTKEERMPGKLARWLDVAAWRPVQRPGIAGFEFVRVDDSSITLTDASGKPVRWLPLSMANPEQHNRRLGYRTQEKLKIEQAITHAGRIEQMMGVIKWFRLEEQKGNLGQPQHPQFEELKNKITPEMKDWDRRNDKIIAAHLNEGDPFRQEHQPTRRPSLKILHKAGLKFDNTGEPPLSIIGLVPPEESLTIEERREIATIPGQGVLINIAETIKDLWHEYSIGRPGLRRTLTGRMDYPIGRMPALLPDTPEGPVDDAWVDRNLLRGEAAQRSAHKEWFNKQPPEWRARYNEANLDQEPE